MTKLKYKIKPRQPYFNQQDIIDLLKLEHQGFSQQKMADLYGISRVHMNRIFNGKSVYNEMLEIAKKELKGKINVL